MNLKSVSGKEWIIKKFKEEEVNFLKENFFLDEIISKLLVLRKIKREDVNTYLNPSIKNSMPNPFLLKDMDKAVKRTVNSIVNNKKIGIFGDYDVDGATSTAILGNFFKEIKIDYQIYIPDRKNEGYGPSIKGFKNLISNGVDLIFTVDCGTLSFKPVEFAKNSKIDVLVLDHHQSDVSLPDAYSIVNPNRIDDNSKLNYLCAAGVCFMFLVALNSELRKQKWFTKNNIQEPNLITFLDLVSLGTICDVVPLIGLNRALVKQGLKIVDNRTNLGLKTISDLCKIESKLTTYHLGYIIGPRINAGGRVGKCSHGANLLLNSSAKNSFKLASELELYNQERQELEKEILKKSNILISEKINDPVIILSGENWHEGVIGIIAARIKDKYNKPTIIISTKNNVGKASARSVVGFDIGRIIISAVQKGILQKGGGHKMAGGFTILIDQISEFKSFIFNEYKKLNTNMEKEKKVYIDSIISPSALNINFYNKINTLAPFGSGNPEPKFSIENLKSFKSKIVGEKHIKSILLASDGTTVKTIAFNSVDSNLGAYLLKKNNPINIAGKLSLNEWKGEKNVEFIIDDISVNKEIKKMVPSSIG